MESDKNKQLREKIKWEPCEIAETRKALLDLYVHQQTAQGTRLIGFVAALFVLLQLTQASKSYRLTEVFASFPPIIPFGNVPLLWDFLKVIFLFLATTLIMYLILRSIFRFAFYGYMSSEIMVVTEDDAKDAIIENAKTPNIGSLWAFHKATARVVYNKKVYWFFPAYLFFRIGDSKFPDRDKQGFLVLLIISLATAFLLLLFLW